VLISQPTYSMRSPLPPGTVVCSRYSITRLLGQGGLAYAYLAEDLGRFSELCVLKELAPIQDNKLEKAWELFQRESWILYQIQHPQIPKFLANLEYKDAQGTRLFLVQDYVAGKTYRQLLKERIAKGDSFSEPEVRTLLLKILPVLGYIHAQGIIHRDITPENLILCQKTLQPTLIDFGIVKEIANSLRESDPDHHPTRVGKLGFAPIEQLQSGRVYPSSDLYALAVTAIVLLTGREPKKLFDDHTATWRWQQWANVTPEFGQVLERMLLNSLEDRFATASEAIAAIESLPLPVEMEPDSTAGSSPSFRTRVVEPGFNQAITITPLRPQNPTIFKQFCRQYSWQLTGLALIALSGIIIWLLGILTGHPPASKSDPKPVVIPSPAAVVPVSQIPLDPTGKGIVSGVLQQNQVLDYRLIVSSPSKMLGLKLIESPNVLIEVLSPQGATLPAKTMADSQSFVLPSRGEYRLKLRLKPGITQQPYRLSVNLQSAPVAKPAQPTAAAALSSTVPKAIAPVQQQTQPLSSYQPKQQKAAYTPPRRQTVIKRSAPRAAAVWRLHRSPSRTKITVVCGPSDATYIVEKVPSGCRIR
jgi:serine/threonine protein kinase